MPMETTTPIENSHSRTYTSYPGSNYLLPSDEAEKERLSQQHHMLKGVFGGNLIAPVTLRDGDNVLECATGTGLWLLEMASTLPKSVTLHGTDIESRLFPNEDSLPENVKFSVASVLDLPSKWNARFNLVHMRLVVFGLQRSEWPVALKEIYRVLAPGGWVQILEVGDWTAGSVNERHKKFVWTLSESRNLLVDCSKHMPSMIANAGFMNIKEHVGSTPLGVWAGELGVISAENMLGVFRGMKGPALAAGGFGLVSSEGDFDKMMDDLHNEWDGTPGAQILWHVFYGQKKDGQ